MSILGIIGTALIAAVLCAALKKYNAEYALLVGICAAGLIAVELIYAAEPAVSKLSDVFTLIGSESGSVLILCKALGICLLTEIASDSCRDAGESVLAGRVETAGRVAVILLALPLFEEVAKLALSLTGGG